MIIRHLLPSDDRLQISRIYEKSWRYAYKGIIPQSYLDSIPSGRWVSNLDQEGINTLVMLENNTFIGTSSYGCSRFPGPEDFGEIISVYLLPEYIGEGYGKMLFRAVMGDLEELGYQNLFLWVLEENKRARRFYEREGFYYSGEDKEDCIGGRKLRELQYRLGRPFSN